jgi:tight adherence protein C
MATTPTTTLMACYILLASIGFYAPQIWLHKKIAGRQRKIAEGFPDALDLMVICVEAGLSLNSAIGRIGSEMKLVHKELSEEFHFLSLELRTGLSRQQALRNLSTRVGLDEVKSLVSVLIQTERFGTSVSNALSVLSTAMRQTRQHKAEEEAAKLPVKLLFPLLLFIFPCLFIVILGPAVIGITRTLFPAFSRTAGN